ncbi:hypothetical protein HUN01_22290 [Nostoc edaphicum CCNP1411]|uniref:Uncharacterized protein n=1 Tax=Nostoc edaphicum CCNP1411 TaxID=1472755 RepID=A0A7D7QUR5_9NOSO|nr:hypothetical protein [Nostoc edaphicum]QMS90183.1 hypothetical protein HUN01_22290 [Nostoc edaphicum CCNP1411]
MSRSQSPAGNAILETPPPLLAAEPPRAAFPAQRLETRFESLVGAQQCCALPHYLFT